MQADATYVKRSLDGSADGYSLPEEVACTLRKPVIQYPNGRVPVDVAKACFPQCKGSLVADAQGTVALDDLMRRFGVSGASAKVRDAVYDELWSQVPKAPFLLTASFAS